MKLFVISDLHGAYPNVKQALEFFLQSGADKLILLGDLLYHGPRNPLPDGYQPQQVFELLNLYTEKIIAVRGNCDSEVDQMVLNFPITSDYQIIAMQNRNVYISHGHIYGPENLPVGIQPGDLFLSGHIHLPIAKPSGMYYVGNPGSLSLPKEQHPPTFGIVDEERWTIYDMNFNPYLTIKLQKND
jgi:uncharacterized protein